MGTSSADRSDGWSVELVSVDLCWKVLTVLTCAEKCCKVLGSSVARERAADTGFLIPR